MPNPDFPGELGNIPYGTIIGGPLNAAVEANGRFGFLEGDGSVSWITGDPGGVGALGSAVVQNPSEELEGDVEGLENVDVE